MMTGYTSGITGPGGPRRSQSRAAESLGEVLGMHRTEPIETAPAVSGHEVTMVEIGRSCWTPRTSWCTGRPGVPDASRATPRVLPPPPITMR